MKILVTADWHIKLGQKNVPKDWQYNRYMMLVKELNKVYKDNDCDLHIIAGDFFDTNKPNPEETKLMFHIFHDLIGKGIIFTGNHEMINKRTSYLDALIINNSLDILHTWTSPEEVTEGYRVYSGVDNYDEFDVVPYDKIKETWVAEHDLLFTHVRGNIEPHVKFEIDPSVLEQYKLVIAGDLHSHKNTQMVGSTQLVYPGSPLTTSFHRELTKGTNGCIVVDTDTLEWEWFELGHLPQLLKKTIKNENEIIEDNYNRIIYEMEGTIDELSKVNNSELINKKINNKVNTEAKLDLHNKTILEEIILYLDEVEKLPKEVIDRVVGKFNDEVNI